MKIVNAAYGAVNYSRNTEPRYVFQVEFSEDPTDSIWIRSHGDITITEPGTVLDAKLSTITALSQKINLSSGNSTIGEMSFAALDINDSLTNHQRTQLINENHGARWRNVRFFHGDRKISFLSYELLQTQILQSVSYRYGEYRFRCADIQRRTRTRVFDAIEMRLALPLDDAETTIEVLSTVGLQAVEHDTGFTDAPSQTVAYVKIDDEIIRVPEAGILPTQLVGVTRGVLGTRAAEHTTSEDESQQGKKVEEVVYLEGPFTKIAYSVLTGVQINQTGTLPDNWHLAIPAAFIRLTDFLEIGEDWYDPSDPTLGLPVRFIAPSKTDGKRWIEKEICRVFSCFMPVDSNGALGWRRNQPVLSGASPVFTITDSMLTSPLEIRYDYEAIINDLTVQWNDIDGTLTRSLRLRDDESIAAWQRSEATFKASGVHGSLYSDETLAAILERFRDRYSNPPLKTKATLLGAYNNLEVGDIVRVKSDSAKIYTKNPPVGVGLLHSFEVQSIRHNPRQGTVTLDLFGASRDAGPLPASFSQNAIPDSFYTALGTDASGLPGVTDNGSSYTITSNLTLTGQASNLNAVYYFDKDVLIPQGVTVTYTQNVQIRVLGVLQVNGEMNGVGNGLAGQADTANLSSIPLSFLPFVLTNPPATSAGLPGVIGTTQAMGALIERVEQRTSSKYRYLGQSVFATITQGTYDAMPGFYVRWKGSLLGVPTDLRGSSGGGGGYKFWHDEDGGTTEITRGGDGGNGGAGLVIIARGMTFGASGLIDSSGADGQIGALNLGDEQPAWSGTGAGGAPGGTLAVIDGPSNPIPVKFGHVVADYGDSPQDPNANQLEDAYVDEDETRFGDPEINGALLRDDRLTFFDSASENVELGTGAFRAVLALPDIPPVEDQDDDALVNVQNISLSVVEAYDDRDDPKVTLINVSVTRNAVTAAYAAAAIFYRKLGTSQWYRAGYAEDDLVFELPADGLTYEIEARAVLVNGFESPTGVADTAFVTDSNQLSAAPSSIVTTPLVNGGVIKVRVPNTLGKPDTVQIFRSQTASDANPALIDTVPVFFVLAENAFCADYVTGQLTGGDSYYYWSAAVNEQGTTSRFPAGDGVALIPDENTGGNPGTPGIDSVAGTISRFEWTRDSNGSFSAGTTINQSWSFSRGATPNIANGTVQGIRNASGNITSIQSIGTSGEAVTVGAPTGLGTPSASVEIVHNQTGQTASCFFLVVSDGDNSLSVTLTNESISLASESDGTGYNLSLASGSVVAVFGLANVTAAAALSVVGGTTKNGLSISLNSGTGAYSFSGASWSTDNETFTIRTTYLGLSVDKLITIAKSRRGQDSTAPGPPGPTPIVTATNIANDGSVVHPSEGGLCIIKLLGSLSGFSFTTPPASATLNVTSGGVSLPGFPQVRSITNVFDSELNTNSWQANPTDALNINLSETPGSGNQTYAVSWTGPNYIVPLLLEITEER